MINNEPSCLATLLNPVSLESFYRTYYEKAILHVSRKGKKNPFGELFRLEDLDHCLSDMTNHNSVMVVKSEENTSKHHPITPHSQNPISTFYDAFYQGNTIVINAMHQLWKPASSLAHDLIKDLGFRVNINMYVTPPNATGFSSHWDSHDVLILQIAGRKLWEFFDGGPELPSAYEKSSEIQYDQQDHGKPLYKLILEPGDILYVPRGHIHRAATIVDTTIHWTLGLHPHTMEDLLHAALKGWARKNRALRQSLPPGYMNEEMDLSVLESRMREMLTAAAAQVHFKTGLHGLSSPWDATRSCGDGHFKQLEMVDHINLDSVLEKRNGGQLHLIPGLDSCLLKAPGFKYQPPGNTYQSIAFMSQHETFSAREIKGWLSEEENLLLIRHLVRHGFLRVLSLEGEVQPFNQLESRQNAAGPGEIFQA